MRDNGAVVKDDDGPLASDEEMSAGTLRDRVIAARIARDISPTALGRQSGLSARTIRDIESGNPQRRYGATTLARLDRPLGWEPGTAWATWNAEIHAAGEGAAVSVMRRAITEQMAALEQRLERMEETPPWAAELINACRLLAAEDRARVLDLARRLGQR